jgi:lysophospholipid acyltransferase (LPLAT)-like uncharacterized protein
MLKSVFRSSAVQWVLGHLLALYFRLMKGTTHFVFDPPDAMERLANGAPQIIAIWHGQNFMLPLGKWPKANVSVLITRHGDGEIIAISSKAFGLNPIRASGGRKSASSKRGGASGLKAMISALGRGESVVMTPDAPKRARVAGAGIIALARLSGAPIYPVCVATRFRIDLKNWDRTSIGLPFGRGAMVVGEPIRISRDADEGEIEIARQMVEHRLDAVHDQAYAHLDEIDPGRELRSNRV